jgi:hypothetical protein
MPPKERNHCTLTPQGQRNQIKKGKSGRRFQEVEIQIETEDYNSTTYPKRARSSDSYKKP